MISTNTGPLYFLYSCFMMAAMLSVNSESNAMYYFFTIIGFGAVYLYLFMFKKKSFFEVTSKDYIFLFICLFLILISFLFNKELMGVILMFMYVGIVYYFRVLKVEINEIIRFVNITYLIYFFVSLISYFGIFFKQDLGINSFNINYGFIQFETLYGIEGSTASIDSYSATVVLLNLFLRKDVKKYIIISIAFLALLWTARFTPLVSFIFSVLVFFIVRNRFFAFLFLTSIFVGIAILIYVEMNYPYKDSIIRGVPNTVLLHIATHGRTLIWASQFENINDYFTFKDYILGNFRFAEVEIYWSDGKTSNSHNSFLYLYLKTGMVAIIMLLSILYKIIKKYDRRLFPVLFGILLASTTNSTIFYVGNPIYLILTIYLLSFYNKTENESI